MAPIRRSALTEFILAAFLMFGQIGVPAQAQAQGKVSFNPDAVTYITTCGTTISTPGTYALANHLTGCSNGTGVSITTSDVTLELAGFSVDGGCFNGCFAGHTGIFVSDPTGGAVKNLRIVGPGTVEDFYDGISFVGAAESQLTGVLFLQSSNCVVFGNTTKSAVSHDNLLTNNTLQTCGGEGIGGTIYSSRVIGNIVNGPLFCCSGIGIHILSGDDNTLSGNSCSAVLSVGIELGGSGSIGATRNAVFGNKTGGNTTGILVGPGADGNTFVGNFSTNDSAFDIDEENAACGTDKWRRNVFTSSNQSCVQ